MDSNLLYQQDPTILEFTAKVIEVISLPDGRTGVVLDRSYFYPTGGGQEHDTGTIGSARVVDAYKDEQAARLVHVVDGQVPSGLVNARIDADRRLRHMQHHTAQHLLTQCILRQTGYETVSANINGYTPSTLDIVADEISKADLDQAELMANRVVYEDKEVKTYFVSPQELPSIPLRRPPKVIENIRIVEIDAFDFSPCGGTHVLHTGSIGLVKIVKVEHQNDKLRVHFIAGLQALETFHAMYENIIVLANQMSTSWQDLPEVVDKQLEQLNITQKELQSLRKASLHYEAGEMVADAEDYQALRLVHASYKDRPVTELRLLAEELKKFADVVAYLASYDGHKVSLIVSCGSGTGKDARQLLNTQLAAIGGRGGGDAGLAQGGGTTSVENFGTFLQSVTII